MYWKDEGYLLSKNNFNENSIIIEAFTLDHGKYAGIVYGGSSRKQKVEPVRTSMFWSNSPSSTRCQQRSSNIGSLPNWKIHMSMPCRHSSIRKPAASTHPLIRWLQLRVGSVRVIPICKTFLVTILNYKNLLLLIQNELCYKIKLQQWLLKKE